MPRPEQPSDEVLLGKAAGGDAGSLAELVARHRDRLWRLCLRLERESHEAEDLFQETFVRLIRSYRSFSGRGRFFTWLYAIALNTYRSRRRSALRGWKFEAEYGREKVAEGAAEGAERAEAAELVREAVNSLPEPQRSAIILSRYEGLSYQQIAEIEHCTEDAVKQRVRRAMERLREALKDLE